MNDKKQKNRIVILIPCYNEEATIGKVVSDFKKQIPSAKIIVYDNNSRDKTAIIAKKAGAVVIHEQNQGKGNVVRSMFRDIDADIYVMVDGDDTYPASEVHTLVDAIRNGADMAIGDRLSSTYYKENKRPFHNFGNNLVKHLVNYIFKSDIKDIMTGYRAFSKKFVKTVAIMSPGFQIETELTVTALVYRYNIVETPITYRDRPKGSVSKLNTFSDGAKVLITLFDMFKNYRPFLFFSMISIIPFLACVIFAISSSRELYLMNNVKGTIDMIVSSSLAVVGLLFMFLGLILDHQANINKKNHEMIINKWISEKNE